MAAPKNPRSVIKTSPVPDPDPNPTPPLDDSLWGNKFNESTTPITPRTKLSTRIKRGNVDPEEADRAILKATENKMQRERAAANKAKRRVEKEQTRQAYRGIGATNREARQEARQERQDIREGRLVHYTPPKVSEPILNITRSLTGRPVIKVLGYGITIAGVGFAAGALADKFYNPTPPASTPIPDTSAGRPSTNKRTRGD